MAEPIYLEREFRELLFSRCYHVCGSLGGIARAMGYPSRPGINGPPRDMWRGSMAIPSTRISALARIASMSTDEILANRVTKEQNEASDGWERIYERYLQTLGNGAQV